MFIFKFAINLLFAIVLSCNFCDINSLEKYTRRDLEILREEVREMFQHAYDSYLKYAYPYDELRPLSCDGVDTWGSYSLTLIDALDTLAVMGNYTEFQRVVKIITTHANFDANINVSVFETNIRIIGGLLSAHLMLHRAGVAVDPGWPCNGPLLQLAEDVAKRLLAAFDTTTGMPYGTVNLKHGVPEGETTITCTAGVGTFILELGTLSRLTGDPLYEEVALNALHALYKHRSPIGLVGNHIDVQTGRWTAQDAGIGAGVDSYYEYLVKGAILFQRPELMHMFHEGRAAIDKYLKRDDWHLWVSMSKGQVTLPVFQSLEAYWPGVLSLIGDIDKGMKSLHNYHQVWKQYGFTPEFYNIPQGEVGANRESYPLRPELIESVMYLYRATGDPFLLDVGKDILKSIQHSAHTPCGYATIKDVRDHRKEDRMESFFLAETTKYLYLLFDPDNFIHNRGQHGTVIKKPWGECVLYAGGYIFNTEAHPIDPGALHCCTGHRQADIQHVLYKPDKIFQGDPVSKLWHTHSPANVPKASEKSRNIVSNSPEEKEIFADVGKEKESANKLNSVSGEVAQNAENIVSETKTLQMDPLIDTRRNSFDLNSRMVSEVNSSIPMDPTENEKETRNDVLNDEAISKEENHVHSSKNHHLGYQVDDGDWVYTAAEVDGRELDVDTSSVVSVKEKEPLKTDFPGKEGKMSQFDTTWFTDQKVLSLSSYVAQLLPFYKSKGKVDHQILLERFQTSRIYKHNTTWEHDYEILSCTSQPFLQRLAMSGEIFGAV